MASALITAGELSAHVDTDAANGWCGLRQLRHAASSTDWLLSPALTLEHYIGVPPDAPEYIQYEPCYSPKVLRDIRPDGCTLSYRPTACAKTTCDITFTVTPPHAVDVAIDATTSRRSWPLGSLALLFATIVRAPVYTGVTFRGYDNARHPKASPWIHFNGHAETPGRVVHPSGLPNPGLGRPQPPPPTYYYADSSLRFDEPFFFGIVGDLSYAVLFPGSQRQYVRFVVNPIAPAFGGPAWDFLWIIPSPEAGRRYRLEIRVLLKPSLGADDIRDAHRAYVSDGPHSRRPGQRI